MKKITFIMLLLSFIGMDIYCQDNIELLYQQLDTSKTDTGKVAILNELGMLVYMSDLDKAEELWQQQLAICDQNLAKPNVPFREEFYRSKAYALASIAYVKQVRGDIDFAIDQTKKAMDAFKQINDMEGMASCMVNIGASLDFQGKADEALVYLNRSFQILDSIGKKADAAMALNNIALIQERKGKIAEAIETHLKAIKLGEETQNQRMLGNSYTNIGTIYQDQNEYEKAYEFFLKGLKARETINDKEGLGKSYNEMAYNYLSKKDTASALIYFSKSLSIRREIEDKQGTAQVLINLGKLYRDNFNKLDSAIILIDEALTLKRLSSDRQGEAYALNALAECYFKQKEYSKAQALANEAYTIAKEINYPINIRNTSLMLSKIYAQLNVYDKAYDMHVLHKAMADSIYNDNTQKAALRQEMKYKHEKSVLLKEQRENERKQQENLARERRNNLQYSGIFVIVLILFALALMSGRFAMSERIAEGLIFFTFLLFFEFMLVLLDPYIDQWSGGQPAYKLVFNAILAGAVFPLHAFFENTLKSKLTTKKSAR